MDKTLIIKELINHYSNGKNVDFAKLLGVKPQTINSWIARNTFDIELIYAKCELIDANWLLTGEGEMLRDERPQSVGKKDDRDETKELLREKIKDQQKIIELLEEKVEALKGEIALQEGVASAGAAG